MVDTRALDLKARLAYYGHVSPSVFEESEFDEMVELDERVQKLHVESLELFAKAVGAEVSKTVMAALR